MTLTWAVATTRKAKGYTVRTDEHKAAFVKRFRSLTHRFQPWQVWSDFVVMFATALSNVCDKTHFEEREAMYLKIVGKYNEQERKVFPELVADIVAAMQRNPEQDFLGSVYMELELGNHWIGQFFTPYDICKCMAKLTVDGAVEEITQKGYITLNDCACGAGATLIAGINAIDNALYLAKSPLNWQNHVLVTAQDLDFTTGMMCYIQLSLLGAAGYVKIGDTLCDPMRTGDDHTKYWYTPMYFSDVWHFRRVFHNLDKLFH